MILTLEMSQLLVFSVTPFKVDQNKKSKPFNKIKSRIWEKKEGKYTKILAKIQVTAIFLMEDMRRNVFPKFRFVWRHHAGAHLDGHQHGGREPAEKHLSLSFAMKA